MADAATKPVFQAELDKPGAWHSHKDGYYLFVYNAETKRWECSGCGEPWA